MNKRIMLTQQRHLDNSDLPLPNLPPCSEIRQTVSEYILESVFCNSSQPQQTVASLEALVPPEGLKVSH
jgi:hypothetical protein